MLRTSVSKHTFIRCGQSLWIGFAGHIAGNGEKVGTEGLFRITVVCRKSKISKIKKVSPDGAIFVHPEHPHLLIVIVLEAFVAIEYNLLFVFKLTLTLRVIIQAFGCLFACLVSVIKSKTDSFVFSQIRPAQSMLVIGCLPGKVAVGLDVVVNGVIPSLNHLICFMVTREWLCREPIHWPARGRRG